MGISEVYEKLIVVAGVASGSGKTSIAETIIKHKIKNATVSAGKITVTHGDKGCPHGGKSCNTCSSLGGDFQIITKHSIIIQKGTDTARFSEAGANPVVWAITKDVAIKDSWHEMKKSFEDTTFIVVESNTLALIEKKAIRVMLVDPTVSRKLWKPTAEKLIAESETLVFNRRGSTTQIDKTIKEVEKLRNGLEDVIYVDHPHSVVNHKKFLEKLYGKST